MSLICYFSFLIKTPASWFKTVFCKAQPIEHKNSPIMNYFAASQFFFVLFFINSKTAKLWTLGLLVNVSYPVSLCPALYIKREKEGPGTLPHLVPHWTREKFPLILVLYKGNRAFADLRCGEEDSISPSTHTFAATNGWGLQPGIVRPQNKKGRILTE